MGKASATFDWLSIMQKSDLSDDIKRKFLIKRDLIIWIKNIIYLQVIHKKGRNNLKLKKKEWIHILKIRINI